MLADPPSQALVENFAGQWLYLRTSSRSSDPTIACFRISTRGCGTPWRRETELFLRGDSSRESQRLDLLSADFTFLNDRLAALRDSGRLRLAVPSCDAPARQPSARSSWSGQHPDGHVVREPDVAGEPRQVHPRDAALDAAAAAAARCPSLKDTTAEGHVLSMRARMEQHRTNPSCASCHAQMDPLGFALENFDAVGGGARAVNPTSRSTARRCSPTGPSWTASSSVRDVLLRPPLDREFARTVIFEDADLCVGPRCGGVGSAVHPRDHARGRAGSFCVQIADYRSCQERAVPDEAVAIADADGRERRVAVEFARRRLVWSSRSWHSHAGRFCAVSARLWRFRCSTRWCRRLTAMARTAAAPIPRIGFIYHPMGTIYEQWTPAAGGAGFEMPRILAPLASLRDQLLVVTGLATKRARRKATAAIRIRARARSG